MKYNILSFFYPLFLFLIFFPSILQAQNKKEANTLSGSVTDESGTALGMGTVTLLSAKDSLVIKGSLTNETGIYSFNHLKAGEYVIRASFVGYENGKSKMISVHPQTDTLIFVPALRLRIDTHSLADVKVTASRPLMEIKPGKVIFHVDNSILAIGNNALEILEHVPGVSVDQNNHVSLRGKQGVSLMINDKLTYLTSDQLGSLLSATDGRQIESIEIMTTPPAKYEASGSAGIINIRLRKAADQGINGNMTVGGGYGRYGRDNTSLNFNYGMPKFNVFGSISRSDTKGFQDITIDRLIHDGTLATEFDQNSSIQNRRHSNSSKIGATYDLSDKNTVGIGFSGYLNGYTDRLTDITTIGKYGNRIDSSLRADTHTASSFHDFGLNLNELYKLDKAGQKLSIDIDYSQIHNNSSFQDTNRFKLPDGSLIREAQLLTNEMPSIIHIYAGKADYIKPISKTFELDAGLKVSKVLSDNDLRALVLKGQSYINDSTRSNHFIYEEEIYAGYLSLKGNVAKTEFELGIRSEFTHSRAELSGSLVTVRSYADFFPSLSLSKSLKGDNNLSFSYSRRIDRPDYGDLNPFVTFLDPYTYIAGNAFLNSQYTDALELGLQHAHVFNVSIGYSRTEQAIMPIVFTKGDISIQTNRNIDQQNTVNFDAYVPYILTKWWSGNIALDGFYTRYRSDTLSGSSIRSGKPAFITKSRQVIQIGPFKGELQANYSSARSYGIFDFKPQFSTDVAVNRSFAHQRFTVNFAVSDLFKTRITRDDSHLLNNDFIYKERYDSRIFRLNLTYIFGNDKLKIHSQHNGTDEEKRRVKQSG